MIVIDLNSMNMFLKHNWLIKHNSEVNGNKATIWFTEYPRECKIKN